MENLIYPIICGVFTIVFAGFLVDWRSFKREYKADMICIKEEVGKKKDKADCTKEMDDVWELAKHHAHDKETGKVMVG